MMNAFLLTTWMLCANTFPAETNNVRIEDYAPCGVNSLYIICRIKNVPTDLESVKRLVGPVASDGTHSFADLTRAGQVLGLRTLGLNAESSALATLPIAGDCSCPGLQAKAGATSHARVAPG